AFLRLPGAWHACGTHVDSAGHPAMKIRNWSKWQSYRKDRGQPPWIKLYRALLRDPDWIALTDAERGQLASIWMLAADRHGEIPNDPEIVRKLCQLETAPDLQLLIAAGFLEHDANMAPSGCH